MNPNGNGLGLSICKKIAENIDGNLTFTSKVGLGSCFTLHLDLKWSSESSATTMKKNNTKNSIQTSIQLEEGDFDDDEMTIEEEF